MNNQRIRVAVMGSGSMSSFRFCYENDPNHGRLYEFAGTFSDRPESSGLTYAEQVGIPAESIDYRAWCRQHGVSTQDLAIRRAYYNEVLDIFWRQWNAEAVMLSGFMLIVTMPLLVAFDGRILNVHPALLNVLDNEGKRKYRGLNVVARAMEAGDATGSTVHLVTKEADEGSIVAMSDPLPYKLGDDPAEHQERMKTACDGPAYIKAFEVLIRARWPRFAWRPH